jgi:hypothetical protein
VKKHRKVVRKVRKLAEPAVEMTRDAARAVFEQVQAAHEKAARALKKRGIG